MLLMSDASVLRILLGEAADGEELAGSENQINRSHIVS